MKIKLLVKKVMDKSTGEESTKTFPVDGFIIEDFFDEQRVAHPNKCKIIFGSATYIVQKIGRVDLEKKLSDNGVKIIT